MRKFLSPVINLVNIILVSIVFGLGANTAVTDLARNEVACGTWYQLVWNPADKANILGIVGFFLFVLAVAFTLVCFIPSKIRKCLVGLTGVMYIVAGVMFLMTPKGSCQTIVDPKLTGSLIAMAVLVFCAGALSLLMSVLDFTEKKEK